MPGQAKARPEISAEAIADRCLELRSQHPAEFGRLERVVAEFETAMVQLLGAADALDLLPPQRNPAQLADWLKTITKARLTLWAKGR